MGEENNKVLESENEALGAGLEFFKRLAAKSERELTQSKARIRELEDAIRKFLEADMELDDTLNHPVGIEISPTLYQAVGGAIRGLVIALSEKSDKEE